MKYLTLIPIILAGCASSERSSVRSRQDDALRDPMNYKPDTAQHDNISGGGTADLNKEALKKDFNSVFNP